MRTLDKVERFIYEINRILHTLSSDYLASGQIEVFYDEVNDRRR